MSNIDKANKIARIIIKSKLGSASPEELSYLKLWIGECEVNKSLYQSLINGESIRKRVDLETSIDTNVDYIRLREGIYDTLAIRRKRRKTKIFAWRVTSAAAACFIIGMILFGDNIYDKNIEIEKNVPHVVYASNTENAKILLKQSNGTVVKLDPNVQKSLVLSESAIIDSEGKLTYTNSTNNNSVELFDEISTTSGVSYSFTLSDGTKVYLNAESKLEYPVKFKGKQRLVKLSGEGFFEVAHDASKPFIVQTGSVKTTALGTSFNISAYSEDREVVTTLLSGKVLVSLDSDNPLRVEKILNPGMQSKWSTGDKNISISEVNAQNVIAWRSGIFMFDEQELSVIIKTLSRWYGVRFEYDQERFSKHTFSGMMNKTESLKDVLGAFTLSGGPKFIIDGKTIKIIDLKQ